MSSKLTDRKFETAKELWNFLGTFNGNDLDVINLETEHGEGWNITVEVKTLSDGSEVTNLIN